jgi:zinc/manganese transport system permease protein
MLSQPFMRNALLAGTAVAIPAGLVGYFLVLRAQVFTADALSHVAFTGALAALAFGVDVRLGLFTLTIAVAVGMGALGPRGRPDDVVIGGVFAWVLGLGVLFLSIYTTRRSASNGSAGVTVLFGSVLGLSAHRAWLTAVIAGGVSIGLMRIARPLLFASVDESVAAARGIPVRLLGLGFLAIAGTTAAEATQVVGALLILGLLAAPAGAAAKLTSRPYQALGLSVALAVASVWVGLTLSYAVPRLPPSFAILAVATVCYALAVGSARRSPSLRP